MIAEMKLIAIVFLTALFSPFIAVEKGEECLVRVKCLEPQWMDMSYFSSQMCKANPELKGDTGPKGETGPDGVKGEIGPAGPKGEIGPDGSKGETGPMGPKGEHGLRGKIGPVGPKGESGNKVAPGMNENFILRNVVNAICPVKFDNKCFFPIIGHRVDHGDAVTLCAEVSGHLANIYSQSHLEDIMNYIRENRMGESSLTNLRVGLHFDPQTNKLTLRDGTDASDDLKWHSDYPRNEATHANWTDMVFQVSHDASMSRQYLFNGLPTNRRDILCEVV